MPLLLEGYRFRRTGEGQPFTPSGMDWCPRCRSEADTYTEASHRGTMYIFKRTCQRCGKVLAYGTFDNVPLLTKRPLQECALEYVLTPGRDRR